jgi:hypothetical protein
MDDGKRDRACEASSGRAHGIAGALRFASGLTLIEDAGKGNVKGASAGLKKLAVEKQNRRHAWRRPAVFRCLIVT